MVEGYLRIAWKDDVMSAWREAAAVMGIKVKKDT